MLQVFRKHAYAYVTRILLLLLGGIFALFFGSVGGFFSRVRPVAFVNCHQYLFGLVTLPGCQEILADDVQREAESLRRTLENKYGKNSAPLLQAANLQQMAVAQLVEQDLIRREARRLGVQVSEDDLAAAIESQTAFQIDGRFDVDLYQRTLRSNDLEPAVFEAETRDKIMTSVMQEMVYNGVNVSNEDARREFDRYGETLNLSYIEFPYTNFTGDIHPTDAQMSKFYHENLEAFREPERVKIIFVRYDPSVLAGNLVPSTQDIEENYEQNLKTAFTHPEQVHARHILISVPSDASPEQKAAAKAKADELLGKLKAGADFAALAKEYSDDPSNKDNGGDLGFFARGEMIKPFEDVAFSLKPGEMAVVQTQYGFHVIRVDAIKQPHVDTVDEAKARIIAGMREKAGANNARLAIEQDLAAALEGRDLAEIAKKRGLVAVATPYIAQNDPIKGAEDNPKLTEQVFQMQSGDVRAVAGASAPFLVKLVDRQPTHIPAFNEIKDQVRDAFVKVTAENQAHAVATAILNQMKSSGGFDAIATTNQLDVRTTGQFVRATRAVPGIGQFPEATEGAATVPSLPGIIDQVLENDGNSFIFKVLTRTPPSEDEWRARGSAFTAQLLEQRRESAWLDFLEGLRRQALVVVREDMLGGSETPAPM
jgi:peptidyl-prolyl cis-trans isomerase D